MRSTVQSVLLRTESGELTARVYLWRDAIPSVKPVFADDSGYICDVLRIGGVARCDLCQECLPVLVLQHGARVPGIVRKKSTVVFYGILDGIKGSELRPYNVHAAGAEFEGGVARA